MTFPHGNIIPEFSKLSRAQLLLYITNFVLNALVVMAVNDDGSAIAEPGATFIICL